MVGDCREMSAAEFDQLFQSVSNWGRWGPQDERGTLNYITPDHVCRAASLVRSGRTVSLSLPISHLFAIFINEQETTSCVHDSVDVVANRPMKLVGLERPRFAGQDVF